MIRLVYVVPVSATEGRAFFGEYLVDNGVVSAAAVEAAARVVRSQSLRLGERCIEKGLLTRNDVRRIVKAQRAEDKLFGELAIEAGLLDGASLQGVLREQRKAQRKIGEVLVDHQQMSATQLQQWLRRFHARTGRTAAASPLSSVHESIIARLPEVVERLTNVPIKVASGQVTESTPDAAPGISLRGESMTVDFAVLCGPGLAEEFARGMLELDPDEVDEDVRSSVVGEICNVVAGAVQRLLLERDPTLRIRLPELVPTQPLRTRLRIFTPRSKGLLLLNPSQ